MCDKCVQPLDRDYPNGTELWQVLISASDEGGMNTATEVWITLEDINDNAPFLRMVSDTHFCSVHKMLLTFFLNKRCSFFCDAEPRCGVEGEPRSGKYNDVAGG